MEFLDKESQLYLPPKKCWNKTTQREERYLNVTEMMEGRERI